MTRRLPFEELFSQVGRFVPSGAAPLGAEVKKNLRALVGAALTRMDLVSREEFDVQSALLVRTRARLADLEKQVTALEAQLNHRQPPAAP
ncbi:MAG: accessory factor UbiK family protein [Pseudomonadota bacterium]|nr:accessory factor UbiK family protein [Pseudomonadota bacterium]